MGKRALVAPVFFASEGRLYAPAWTFSALSAVGVLESTERQQSANCGLSGLEAERRRLHVLTFRSATYKHL